MVGQVVSGAQDHDRGVQPMSNDALLPYYDEHCANCGHPTYSHCILCDSGKTTCVGNCGCSKFVIDKSEHERYKRIHELKDELRRLGVVV